MIVNYASSIINKLEALLTDEARVVIYDRHVFIVQSTGVNFTNIFSAKDEQLWHTSFLMLLMGDRIWQKKHKTLATCAKILEVKYLAKFQCNCW